MLALAAHALAEVFGTNFNLTFLDIIEAQLSRVENELSQRNLDYGMVLLPVLTVLCFDTGAE